MYQCIKANIDRGIKLEIYRNNLSQLREDIQSVIVHPPIFEENPQIFKLKLDLSLSPRNSKKMSFLVL
mgnify:CR=1 FL=1